MDKKRCPKGERKDPKTGECIKMSDELIKHKQSLRNKKKGVMLDENNNKIKPARRITQKNVTKSAVTRPVVSPTPTVTTPVVTTPMVTTSAVTRPAVTRPVVTRPVVTTPVVTTPVVTTPDISPTPSVTSPRVTSPSVTTPPIIEKEPSQVEKIISSVKNVITSVRDTLLPPSEEDNDETLTEKKSEEPKTKTNTKSEDDDDETLTEKISDDDDDETLTEKLSEQEPVMIKTNDKNAFLLKKEQIEYNALLKESQQKTETYLYPTLDDPDFNYKIARRQEFADTKYDGKITNIREQADILCKSSFELMPHQLFVKNFLSFQTPYNSLLLYHGLGSGKTCSAIGIAEEMRGYMKQIGFTKKIIIVASPNVQDNFRLQLFDERKLELMPDGQWNLNTCIGNALLHEINPTNLRGLTKEKISSQIRTLINNYYVFMGDKGEFANYIKKVTFIPEDAGLSEKDLNTLRTKKIKSHFNNRLVIIDEIHNIRISDANKNKLTSILLNEIAKKSDNMRLLLLSATPLYNSYNEIIWLVNLLNANDKRGLIKIEDVFNNDGTFIEGDPNKGKELLIRKLTGYISYVRGENPYIFPYRIYPSTFDEERLITGKNYPTLQMNQAEIIEPLQYVPVYKNGIGEYQSSGYQFIITYLGLKSNTVTDKRGKTRIMPSFENMESFGYTLLLAPLESLIMVYPNPKLDIMIQKKRDLDKINDVLDLETFDQEENKEIIKSIIGKTGLSNIMKYETSYEPVPRRSKFEYKKGILQKYGEIFSPEHIHKYSAKISNICNIIKKPSKGIILIYSQYIDGGVIPMALALESMGFSRYASTQSHNVNLLKPVDSIKSKKELIDSLTMKPKSQIPSAEFKPAKYVIITGDKDFSQNNNDDIKYITNKENTNGELVKVIIISRAASEGLDFKNIRQVHILEPWYNMNRNEQIIGRGVRNLSHCNLPFEERNVEIYLHGTILDKDEEAADLYVYRSAEKKAVQIGRVTRLLKEISVDCQLNISQTNFTEEKLLQFVENQNIKINLSSGKTVPFKIGDSPFTDVCDYMDNCSYQCIKRNELPELTDNNIIKTTYEEPFVKNNSMIIMKKIRDLFLEKVIYKREHLINAINRVKKYPIEHIYYALTRFINNKTDELTDKYGRSGYLVSRGNYYVFQPNEIMDESASIFERSIPVDYKHTSLKMELPKEIKPTTQTIDQTMTQEIMDKRMDKRMDTIMDTRNEPSAVMGSYEDIMKKVINVMKIVSEKNISVKASDKNWYKHANVVITELLNIHEIPEDLINKYIIYHFLDYLHINEKLIIVSNIYSPKYKYKNGYDNIFKLYFDDLLIENDENERAIILSNGETNILYVENETGVWNEAEYTDKESFKLNRFNKFIIPKERINKTEIGFMSPFKGKELSFKIKDMTQKRNNKGAKCEDASKPVIAEKIGIILNERGIYSETSIEKPDLCVILEILMRWITEQNKIEGGNGIILFFGPEQSNEMNITNLRII